MSCMYEHLQRMHSRGDIYILAHKSPGVGRGEIREKNRREGGGERFWNIGREKHQSLCADINGGLWRRNKFYYYKD